MKNLEIDPHKYGQIIFSEGTKVINRESKAFPINDARTNGFSCGQKKEPQLLTLFTKKMNLRWRID